MLYNVPAAQHWRLFQHMEPQLLCVLQEHAITSNEALSLPDLPKGPIAIVGAGYISLEFAGIWNGMGKEVHLVYRKSLPLVG